ncbi:hypothetical protein C8J57DRAFT_1220026 [Mycena rebaudengoi]|nr:hypothetical protein C8J57DRAFT_1220026 [Mycena rebaudengoi]
MGEVEGREDGRREQKMGTDGGGGQEGCEWRDGWGVWGGSGQGRAYERATWRGVEVQVRAGGRDEDEEEASWKICGRKRGRREGKEDGGGYGEGGRTRRKGGAKVGRTAGMRGSGEGSARAGEQDIAEEGGERVGEEGGRGWRWTRRRRRR